MKDLYKAVRNPIIFVILTLLLKKIGFDETSWVAYLILLLSLTTLFIILNMLLPWLKSMIVQIYRCLFIRVAILNGSIKSPVREYKCERSNIKITPEIWIKNLELVKKVNRITTREIDNKWNIIINPYGDNFPEEDLRLHKTFYSICDYIYNGGIFVISGGAFYWNQNTLVSKELKAFVTFVVDGISPLDISPLTEEFGVKYTGDNPQAGKTEPVLVKVYQQEIDKQRFGDLLVGIDTLNRFRATTSGSSDFLPVIREQDNDTVFPVAIIPYGKGYLIHFGLKIDSEDSNEFKVIMRMLEIVIKGKMKNIKRNI